MALPNPSTVTGVNNITEAIRYFYQEYKKAGVEYTRGYLSAFKGSRKILAEHSLSGESDRYLGAKQALEDMLNEQGELNQ